MNRRGFLGQFLGAAALAAPAVAEAVPSELPDTIVSGGIEARWLGWKARDDQDVIHGTWLFILSDQRMLYSTTGGIVTRDHHQGNVFNLCVLDDNWLTSLNDTPERRRELRAAAYERGIKDAIAWLYEPKPNTPEYTFGFTGFKPPR